MISKSSTRVGFIKQALVDISAHYRQFNKTQHSNLICTSDKYGVLYLAVSNTVYAIDHSDLEANYFDGADETQIISNASMNEIILESGGSFISHMGLSTCQRLIFIAIDNNVNIYSIFKNEKYQVNLSSFLLT